MSVVNRTPAKARAKSSRERDDADVRVADAEVRQAIAEGVELKEALRRAAEVADSTAIPEDANHLEIAQAVLMAMHRRSGWGPVAAMGSLWVVRDDLWVPMTPERLAIEVAHLFAGRAKLCRRGSDFSAIARIVLGLADDPEFFDQAPAGVAGPSAFWRIAADGRIEKEVLSPEHRQRLRISADPDDEADTPLFDRLLRHAFGAGPAGDGQRRLLQQVMGAALARSLYLHRLAVLLLGASTSGKSTLLQVLAGMLPRDLVGATSPQRWDNEYYVAGLAGKVLNIVGELDPDHRIPGGPFKTVVGCDVVEGRHPTHRPFSFVCTAAHFFNANRLPPTVDRSDAFFRRWRVIEFKRSVAPEEVIVNLSTRILEEEAGGVVAWMLRGAADVAETGGVIETAEHSAAITRWRYANNNALQFLLDPEECLVAPDDETAKTRGAKLYQAYATWARRAGVQSFGRNNFYEAIDEGAGRFGVFRKDDGDGVSVVGVRLVRP